jgi:putative tryptophan/tyrosine transport system substrate-binding protein
MSAFGGKADMTVCGNPLSRSLLSVTRNGLLHRICPPMTQSGHRPTAVRRHICPIWRASLNPYDALSLASGEAMRRREFITLIGGAAAMWPLAAFAQQTAIPVVGYLSANSPEGGESRAAAFRRGLQEAGYGEGQNVTVEYHWAEEQADRLPAMAADLVKRRVTVIATGTTPAVLAAQAATTTIPIVFEMGSDPVRLGLVANLNRPGGNVTGVTNLVVEVTPKRLELLHELLPAVKVMALLVNPADRNLAQAQVREVLSAARNLGLELHVLNAANERDFDAVFADIKRLRVGGLVIGAGTVFTGSIKKLAALTVRHAVPAIYLYRDFPAAGGLMSYASDVSDSYRLAGVYTGRVLKGENPAELPVVQATKFELIINLKTAKAFGITVPNTIVGRADELIE